MQIAHRDAIIGDDLTVTAEISNGGTIEVRGLIQGVVAAQHLVIRPGGRVLGIIKVDTAEIGGLMQGNVSVRQLMTITSSGVVRGDVRYGQIAMSTGGELIGELRNVPPEIAGDFQIVVRRGRSVTITTSDISAYDPDDAAGNLTFSVSRPVNGAVVRFDAPRSAIGSFTQQDLLAGAIQFAHDASAGEAASFEVIVTDKAGASSGAPKTVAVTVV